IEEMGPLQSGWNGRKRKRMYHIGTVGTEEGEHSLHESPQRLCSPSSSSGSSGSHS
ncbi:hypothetical protein SUGI_0269200, partial [Cryptomeria japonica]